MSRLFLSATIPLAAAATAARADVPTTAALADPLPPLPVAEAPLRPSLVSDLRLPRFEAPLPVIARRPSLRSESEAREVLTAHRVVASQFNVELYLRGLALKDMQIGFDLDGTIIDFATLSADDVHRVHLIQPKPGAEALLLGLARHNALSLHTASDAHRVRAIFEHLPALRRAFADASAFEPGRRSPWPRVFTSEDAVDGIGALLVHAAAHRPLTPAQVRILEICGAHRDRPRDLLHLKSPTLAGLAGKAPFRILVDDSDRVEQFARSLGEDFSLLKVPFCDAAQTSFDLNDLADDRILRIADALERPWFRRFNPLADVAPLPRQRTLRFQIDIPASVHIGREAILKSLIKRFFTQSTPPSDELSPSPFLI